MSCTMKSTLSFSIIFVVAFRAQANLDYFSNLRCVSKPGILQDMNSKPDVAKAHVFSGMEINCDGKVAVWEFMAQELGSFFASVWRRDRNNNTMKLVGKNWLTATNTTYIRVEIPFRDRIRVVAGDVIGFHYKSPSDPAVITMETGTSSGMQLSNVSLVSVLDEDLTEGTVLKESETIQGVAALRASVHGVTQWLSLRDGPNHHEGRAEMFKFEVWGTICDIWFVTHGWPLLFCYELGFPGVLFANTTSELQRAQVVNDSVPIHEMNPICKPSDNGTILNCQLHSKRTCTHESDVYISCQRKVQLIAAPGEPGWGSPQVFDEGFWGNICDNRPPSFHMENATQSWVTAFCIELGHQGLAGVMRAPIPLNHTKSVMENPDCSRVDKPTRLTECPSGPLETECDTHLYYVKCHNTAV